MTVWYPIYKLVIEEMLLSTKMYMDSVASLCSTALAKRLECFLNLHQ